MSDFCLTNVLSIAGSVQFVQSPPAVVYYPPPGFPGKTVVCATNTSANIIWVTKKGDHLNQTIYNISQVSDRNSTMYITAAFIVSDDTIAATLGFHEIHCEAGAVKTSGFRFKEGGNTNSFKYNTVGSNF